jgi:uncharacterized membrane protein
VTLHTVARLAGVGLLGAGYLAGTHWLMTRSHPSAWDVVGVLAPMLVAVMLGAWRSGQRGLGSLAALALLALCGQALAGAQVSVQGLYLAQHAGIHGVLAYGFGSSLRRGATPLVAALAARVHPRFTAAMAAYCRRLTGAWTLYFVGMAALSVALFFTANFDTWAVFANLVTPASLVAMFVGEHHLRYLWHPEFERVSLTQSWDAYRQGTAAAPQALAATARAPARPRNAGL